MSSDQIFESMTYNGNLKQLQIKHKGRYEFQWCAVLTDNYSLNDITEFDGGFQLVQCREFMSSCITANKLHMFDLSTCGQGQSIVGASDITFLTEHIG